MRTNVLIIFLVIVITGVFARNNNKILPDSVFANSSRVVSPDSLDAYQNPAAHLAAAVLSSKVNKRINPIQHLKFNVLGDTIDADTTKLVLPAYIEPVKIDTLLLQGNPFFIELVFMGYPNNIKLEPHADFKKMYFGQKATTVSTYSVTSFPSKTPEQVIADLRYAAREYISRTAADLYVMSYTDLPDPNQVKSRLLQGKSIRELNLLESNDVMPDIANKKIYVKKEQLSPWRLKANGMLQFSQNMSSDNWYQGSNSMMAVLGILTGQMNYDNKKNIQFENNGEWRMGFNAVFNDPNTKRAINTNDDVLKINSKLGVRASENFFYSSSFDFSTQFLNNYKSVNSDVLKSMFLSPIRINIGVGLDYKYKNKLSLMLAPVSYKYLYVLETDPAVLNPNLFGIKSGEDHLSEIGSSFKAQYSYSPFRELQVDSRLSFYTNYTKVEIDCEIVGNFTINRFLSTRVSLNPRYDNTVILAAGEKAKLQFKELISFGFSYKLLN